MLPRLAFLLALVAALVGCDRGTARPNEYEVVFDAIARDYYGDPIRTTAPRSSSSSQLAGARNTTAP